MLPRSNLAVVPPFSPSAVFTEWGLSPVLFVLLVWASGLYLYGVWRLHDRGDHWPVGRTLAFVVGGMGSFFFATSSGLAAYDTTLLSVHMVQHMILSMAVPLFCALGAPVTLALRTLPQRPRGVAAGGAALPGGQGADLRAAHAAALRGQPVGALLHRLVRRDAALELPARADARAPRRGRARCSSPRSSASTRCPGG